MILAQISAAYIAYVYNFWKLQYASQKNPWLPLQFRKMGSQGKKDWQLVAENVFTLVYMFLHILDRKASQKNPWLSLNCRKKKTVHGKKTSRGTEPQTPVIQILRYDGRKASQIFA